MNPETMEPPVAGDRDDSGLIAYATILALHRIAVDPNQLRHGVGHDRAVDADDLKRIAKRQDEVRAKSVRSTWEKLKQTPLPAMAKKRSSGRKASLPRPSTWTFTPKIKRTRLPTSS